MTNVAHGTSGGLHTDGPIETIGDDGLERKGFAKAIARQIQLAPRHDSFVLAVVGEWGIGKTSILNMVEDAFRTDPTHVFLWFNPWMFSGQEQLVAHFFQEIAAQLREKEGEDLRNVWRGFEGYSRLLEPLRPVPAEETRGELRGPSVRKLRGTLVEELRRSKQRLVVVIDDIDRLVDQEIRDVMRLVRLVGDFPNVVYLLSYDEERVAEAVGAKNDVEQGRAYLEKIVQIVHRVPRIRPSTLVKYLQREIDEVTRGIPRATDDGYEQEIRSSIAPLFGNLRDVHRYINSIRPTLDEIGEKVALPDLLALEALRVLRPDAWKRIGERATALTSIESFALTVASPSSPKRLILVKEVDGIIESDAHVEAVVELVFPLFRYLRRNEAMFGRGENLLKHWRRMARVACAGYMETYLDMLPVAGVLAPSATRGFLGMLFDGERVKQCLNAQSVEELEALVEHLDDYVDEKMSSTEAEQLIVSLLQQHDRIGPLGSLDQLIAHCLQRMANDSGASVRRIVDQCEFLSSKLLIVNAAEALQRIDSNQVTELRGAIAAAMLRTEIGIICREPQLRSLIYHSIQYDSGGVGALVMKVIEDDRHLLRLGAAYPLVGFEETRTLVQRQSLDWWIEMKSIVDPRQLAHRVRRIVERVNEGELHLDNLEEASLKAAKTWLSNMEIAEEQALT